MKKNFSTGYHASGIDTALLLTRIVISILMLVHGLPKMASLFSGDPVQFPPVFGLSPMLALSLVVFAEVICSILLLVGLGTRLATLPLIVTMLVAAVYIHANDPFAKQELAFHYLLTYTILLITGAGKFSLDHLLQQKPLRLATAKTIN